MSTTVLRGENLCWQRPLPEGGTAQVLENATLNVGAGEMVTLQGSSGTGKTVLGSLLLEGDFPAG